MKDYKITEIRFEKILGIDYFERSIIIRINGSLYKGTDWGQSDSLLITTKVRIKGYLLANTNREVSLCRFSCFDNGLAVFQ